MLSSVPWPSLALLLSLSLLANALSVAQNDRLTDYSFIAASKIDILTRNEASLSDNHLRHNDSFRLSLSAFNRTFHLHLIPNDHLIPEDAVATVYDENNVKKVINLHGQVRAYKGVVVESEFTDVLWDWDNNGVLESFEVPSNGRFGLSSGFAPLNSRKKTDMNVGTASVVVLHDGFNEHSNSHLQNHYPDHRQPVVIGTLTTNSEVYHIQPTHSYRLSKRSVDPSLLSISARNPEHQSSTMIIYRDSDFKRSAILQKRNEPSAEATCGADRLAYNKNYTQQHPPLGIKQLSAFEQNLKEYQSSLQDAHTSRRLVKRQAGRRQLSSSIGCPVDTRMLYIGMAADCSYSARFKNNETDIFTQLVNNINSVSELYQRTFNLGIGITKIEIRTSCGKDEWNRLCDNAYPIGKRLSDFSNWRSSQPPTEALWHLMTDCPTRSPNGGGDTLGIAWSGTVCETQARQQSKNGGVEIVSGTGVSSAGRTEWKIVAHEIAHNLGAIHDCTSTDVCTGTGEGSCCPCNGQCDCGKQFIMNPTDNTASSDFSPCSISDVCTTIGAKLNQCFQRPGSRQTLQGQVCGNGILEPGEECDCGQNCANDRCCTSECKLKPPAVCSDRNHACCSQCQFKPRGTVCRPALSTCDIEEACPGDNGLCPTDVTLPNGQKCRVNGTDAYCASGQCTSKDLQCQVNSKGRFKQTCRGGARDDCSLVCQDPTNEIRCAVLDQLLLDGTECGFGGECAGGQCQNSSIFNVPKRWISENLPWAIAIGVILGLGVLWCIWISCIRSCFTRRKRPGLSSRPTAPAGRSNNQRPSTSPSRVGTTNNMSQTNPYRSSPSPNKPMPTYPNVPPTSYQPVISQNYAEPLTAPLPYDEYGQNYNTSQNNYASQSQFQLPPAESNPPYNQHNFSQDVPLDYNPPVFAHQNPQYNQYQSFNSPNQPQLMYGTPADPVAQQWSQQASTLSNGNTNSNQSAYSRPLPSAPTSPETNQGNEDNAGRPLYSG